MHFYPRKRLRFFSQLYHGPSGVRVAQLQQGYLSSASLPAVRETLWLLDSRLARLDDQIVELARPLPPPEVSLQTGEQRRARWDALGIQASSWANSKTVRPGCNRANTHQIPQLQPLLEPDRPTAYPLDLARPVSRASSRRRVDFSKPVLDPHRCSSLGILSSAPRAQYFQQLPVDSTYYSSSPCPHQASADHPAGSGTRRYKGQSALCSSTCQPYGKLV